MKKESKGNEKKAKGKQKHASERKAKGKQKECKTKAGGVT